MTSSDTFNYRLLALRMLGGGAGGLVWGLLRGLTDSRGLEAAMKLGFYTMVAAILVAVVGHFLFRSRGQPDLVGKPRAASTSAFANWAILGAVFIGVSLLIAPAELAGSLGSAPPAVSILGGAVGGGVGGLFYELFRDRSPRSLGT